MDKKEIKELFKERHINQFNAFFGENNYKETNNRFQCLNQVISNDEIILITNNVQYFKAKDQFVLWINNDKIVYLKSSNVWKVFNYEFLGDCYLIKLNRNYFKGYNCFTTDKFLFEKEDTFDSLLEIAKTQTTNKLWFKFPRAL